MVLSKDEMLANAEKVKQFFSEIAGKNNQVLLRLDPTLETGVFSSPEGDIQSPVPVLFPVIMLYRHTSNDEKYGIISLEESIRNEIEKGNSGFESLMALGRVGYVSSDDMLDMYFFQDKNVAKITTNMFESSFGYLHGHKYLIRAVQFYQLPPKISGVGSQVRSVPMSSAPAVPIFRPLLVLYNQAATKEYERCSLDDAVMERVQKNLQGIQLADASGRLNFAQSACNLDLSGYYERLERGEQPFAQAHHGRVLLKAVQLYLPQSQV